MNKRRKERMKRRLAIALIAAIILSFYGCSSDKEKPQTEQEEVPAGQEENNPEGEAENSPEGEAEKDYSEHLVISLASVQVNESVDYNNGDEFTKWWTDKYNFEWDITGLSWDMWAERLRVWINSGDMPDVATWDYNHGEAMSYIDQGLLYRLPDDWKERWPNVAKAYEDSELGPALEEKTGGTYILPKPIFSTMKPTEKVIPHVTAYIRKDWAQAVGFELKDYYTVSEILEYARLIREKDPGQLGGALVPIAARPDMALNLFVKSNSTYAEGGFHKDGSGAYQWGPADEATLTGLKLYQEAYKEGLLSPEFYAYTGEDDNAQFMVTGIAGVTLMQGMAGTMDYAESTMESNLSLNYDDAVHTCFIIGEDGKYHSPEQINYWTTVIFSPDISQEKFERYMDMMDFASSEEANVFIRMGFEGVDWEYDANGEIVSLLGDQTMGQKYPSVFPCYDAMYILADEFQLINPAYRKEFRDRVIELYQTKYEMGDEESIPSIDWDVQLYSSDAKNKLSYDWGTEYAELVLSDGNIEDNWKNWIASQDHLIKPVIDELNSNFGNK
jgi:putative aldouronate transport system substrate-binding protein